MGAAQSHADASEASSPVKTVRIEKDEIPEEFRNVGVSNEVVDRVLSRNNNSAEFSALKAELYEARRRNEELITELRKSNDKDMPFHIAGGISLEDLENRRQALNEAISRVEKQFCSFQRENVCESQEKEIMQCIVNNKDRVLNCLPLLDSYQDCVTNFRKAVLSEKSI
ncbi:unnamed protein product [Enterobius vermicularis]|uniref:MICOS complex subunit MIC19 n=1 Tax=Enterobius vermicularis TaxID=51028 RepID=A0A0N4V811_ENTVE|nr:unnamed protein product [Enterobius vermicularis]